MSSVAVRDLIANFLETEIPTETVIDLTADFEELKDVVTEAGLGPRDPWLGLQFVGADEEPIDIAANNVKGGYRELGVIYLHVVELSKLGPKRDFLLRVEAIRDKFRGRRIGNLSVKAVSPPQFGVGATLNFSGGYTGCLISIDYDYDFYL